MEICILYTAINASSKSKNYTVKYKSYIHIYEHTDISIVAVTECAEDTR